MKDRLLLLGTSTCNLEMNRMASSVLVEAGNTRLVFDFGRGISQRLVEAGFKQNDIHHIVLSHFHPDHWSDLVPYLHAACWSRIDPRAEELHVYGPAGVTDRLTRLIDLFEMADHIREKFHLQIHEVLDGKYLIGGLDCSFHDLPPAGNRGIKFSHQGKTAALTGDSQFHDEEISFLKDADLAVVDSGHLQTGEIIRLAVASQAKTIICSHLYNSLDERILNEETAKVGYGGRLVVGKDLMEFPL